MRIDYPPATRGRLIVWGMLARQPFGGMTWQVLHHVVALRRLGFDVWYVEDSDSPLTRPDMLDRSLSWEANVAYLAAQMERVGLGDRWAFRPSRTNSMLSRGGESDPAGVYRDADAVFNLCGAQELLPHHSSIRRLVLLQTDPVKQQIELAQADNLAVRTVVQSHDHLYTYGTNIGSASCDIPTGPYEWLPTLPPVVLDWWGTDGPPPDGSALTTIANWKISDRDVTWRGRRYSWRKGEAFRLVEHLPAVAPLQLELALVGIGDEDRARMQGQGWRIVSGRSLKDPDDYRDYIQDSLGEFTVAKEQSVATNSGWFSDRSACYLAAGRPVIVEDTGIGSTVPVGEGLLTFSTPEEALEGIAMVAEEPERHRKAAFEIAASFFDASKVLGRIVDEIGLG